MLALMSVTSTRPAGPHLPGHSFAQIAAAGGYVQCRLAGPKPCPGESKALPGAVQARRHEIVHEIVAVGDGVEYAPHPALLFVRGDAVKTEIYVFPGIILARRHALPPLADALPRAAVPGSAASWPYSRCPSGKV